MRWYRWLGINAALFLSTFIIFSYAAYVDSLALGQQHDPVEIALAPLGLAVFLGPLYAVGFALYLPAVTLIPGAWGSRDRRLAAVLLSPIVGALVTLIQPPPNPAIVAYGLVPSVLFGLVVRLVEPVRQA